MKPAEAVGLIRFNRRFGRSKIVKHMGGKIFRCKSLERHPGVYYTTSWGSLKKSL